MNSDLDLELPPEPGPLSTPPKRRHRATRPPKDTTPGEPPIDLDPEGKALGRQATRAVQEIAEEAESRWPELAGILKRDAPKMGAVISHHAARHAGFCRVVKALILVAVGPGSIFGAFRAFAPTLRTIRDTMRVWREAREEEPESDSPED